MMRILKEAALVVVLGSALGLAADVALPDGALLDLASLRTELAGLTTVHYLSAAEAAAQAEAGDLLLVDGRPAAAYAAGHPRGAASLPLDEIGSLLRSFRNRVQGQRVAVLLPEQHVEDARQLAERLKKELGASFAASVMGGWEEWQRRGLPIQTGAEP